MNIKSARLRRIIDLQDKKSVILPLDHGVTYGPISGIENIRRLLGELLQTKLNAVILHKGMLKEVSGLVPKSVGLIMHLSASLEFSSNQDYKRLIGSVEEAIRLGADAVSMQINLGYSQDDKMLADFGRISEECSKWNMPLIVMAYTVIKPEDEEKQLKYYRHCIRLCEELGADMVKVSCCLPIHRMKNDFTNTGIPILVAGGEKKDEEETLAMVESAMEAGASGVMIGRNVFQSETPKLLMDKICNIVHTSI